MSTGRLFNLGGILMTLLVLVGCSSDSPTQPKTDTTIKVDLSRFPVSGDPVPDQTVLTDQWASIGIIFGAEPAGVNLIKHNFGTNTSHIFFSPDVEHAIAVFEFVQRGTTNPADVTAFALSPWFNPGESAELVGLDEGGTEVAVDTVDSGEIGSESRSIRMSIQGTFRVVEWRTHGNPGIAASDISFKF
jgi:hypothetical protein